MDRLLSGEFLRYLVVGAGTNLVVVLAFVGLLLLLPGVWPVVLNITASLLALPLSFLLNRKWVFRSEAPMPPQIRRFALVYLSALVAGALIFGLLLSFMPTPVLVTQLVSAGILVLAAFLVQALWTFAAQ